jgi:hypothetical protein
MPTTKPTSLRIRAYDVGFGDCFLLTFKYPKSERHVLIDFGSFPKPKRKTAGDLVAIAKHISQACGNQLTAVVATHRHADHINGFATRKGGKGSGDIIRTCKPKAVIQPWTEHPNLGTQAAGPKGFVAADRQAVIALGEMRNFRRAMLSFLEANQQALKGARTELAFLGENGLGNLSAVKNLMTMASPKSGQKYVHFGTASGLDQLLPGVKVKVLGPPTIKQSSGIEAQRKKDQTEFWHILAATADTRNSNGRSPFAGRFILTERAFPGYAQWLVQHADALTQAQLLSIVRRMDDFLNNTSVILLFEAGGKKLLFPGDAQIENWSFALSKPAIRALLESVDVLKVGHHGSLNATPKASLWARFKKKGSPNKPGRLVTMMSTEPGHHGKPTNATEVPRTTLVSALQGESKLLSTHKSKLTREQGVAFLEHTVAF